MFILESNILPDCIRTIWYLLSKLFCIIQYHSFSLFLTIFGKQYLLYLVKTCLVCRFMLTRQKWSMCVGNSLAITCIDKLSVIQYDSWGNESEEGSKAW